MRPALFAAAIAATLASPAAYAAAFGYDLCAFTTQILKVHANDFGALRGEMLQSGAQHDMKQGGAEYALMVKPGDDAACGILGRGVDNYDERVPARIYCSLGSARPFAHAASLYDMAIAELRLCYPRAKFNSSRFGDVTKPGELVRWSTEIEDSAYSLVISMSALPDANRLALNGQFTVRYQLWNTASGAPAKRTPVKKSAQQASNPSAPKP